MHHGQVWLPLAPSACCGQGRGPLASFDRWAAGEPMGIGAVWLMALAVSSILWSAIISAGIRLLPLL